MTHGSNPRVLDQLLHGGDEHDAAARGKSDTSTGSVYEIVERTFEVNDAKNKTQGKKREESRNLAWQLT